MSASPALGKMRRHLWWGLVLVLMLLVGLGGWASATSISGAVIANGTVVVDSYVKPVQHEEGGTVSQILVSNGQPVLGGDVLVTLDGTQIRAGLAIIDRRLVELRLRAARFTAVLEDRSEIEITPEIEAMRSLPGFDQILAVEQQILTVRQSQLEGQIAQLDERIEQLEHESEGVSAQIESKIREIDLTQTEADSLRTLLDRGLTEASRINLLDREVAQLQGQHGALVAQDAQTMGKIVETRLQQLQLRNQVKSEATEMLSDTRAQIGEFEQRRISAANSLDRLDIRAPQDGVIHNLAVHAAGAVIAPGEVILEIVPVADNLSVDVRVAPQDIDQLVEGQSATLRFSAFSYATTPELTGRVVRIGADLTNDETNRISYYLVRVGIESEQLDRLTPLQPVPGMPVEAFFPTESRSALSYFLKPISDQVTRAFREE